MCQDLIKAIDAYIAKADDDLEKELESEGYVAGKATVEAAEKMEDKVAELLENETKFFIKKINESFDLEDFAEKIWPLAVLDDDLYIKLAQVFEDQFAEYMPNLIELYIQQTDRELTLQSISKKTTAWIHSWSEELGRIMQLNSQKEIENILSTGLEEGWGCDTFAQKILDSGIRNEYYKARKVAITEVLRAHSVSQQEAFMQSPAVENKQWRHTGGHKNEPRQNHIDMDGQIVAKDKPYALVGADGSTYHPMYPRDTVLPPGESINCHCISEPIVNPNIIGLSLEERQKLQQEAIQSMDDAWEKELNAKNKAKAGIEE